MPKPSFKFFFEAGKGKDSRKVNDALWSSYLQIRTAYSNVQSEWVQFGKHYNHRHWNRSIASSSNLDSLPNPGGANKITLNVTKNIIDTIHSRITKHQPDLTVLAEQDDPEAEAQADYLEKFLRERFKTLHVEQRRKDNFLDACIYGTGITKVVFNKHHRALTLKGFKEIGEIEVKRVVPYDFYVDFEMLGANNPNWSFELEWMHVLELAKKYPDVNFSAELGKSDFPNRLNLRGRQSEYIPVLHFYHKVTNYMPKGRYVLCTRDAVLEDEDFDSHYLPYVYNSYTKSPTNFWGTGLGKQLRSIQIEINKILYHMSQNQNLMGRPKLFLPSGSNTTGADQNGIGVITGDQKPEYLIANPTPPELFKSLEFLIQQAYESVGLSQGMSNGEPPPQVRSALAMEHQAERENDRFALLLIGYEDLTKEIAHRIRYEARRNYKKEDKRWFQVIANSRSYEKLEFDKLDLEEENCHLDTSSANSIGHTQAGRLEFLMNLVQMGLIKDPSQIMDLMRIPNEDKIYDSVTLDTRIAGEENLRMSNGEKVETSEFEDQQAHIKTHIADIKSSKFIKQSPAVRKLKEDHLHEHFALAQQAQQQQQQQQQQAMQQQANAQAQAQATVNPQQPPTTQNGQGQ